VECVLNEVWIEVGDGGNIHNGTLTVAGLIDGGGNLVQMVDMVGGQVVDEQFIACLGDHQLVRSRDGHPIHALTLTLLANHSVCLCVHE
jgi:hypothetical protein